MNTIVAGSRFILDDNASGSDFPSFFDTFDVSELVRDSALNIDSNIVLHRDLFHSEESIFYMLYGKHPSNFDIKIIKTELKSVIESLTGAGFKLLSCSSDARHKLTENIYFNNTDTKTLIRIYISSERDYAADTQKTFTLSLFFDIESLEAVGFAQTMKKQYTYSVVNNHNVYLFQKDEYGEMCLQPYDIKGFDIDIDKNYNDDFVGVHDKIISWAKDFELPNNRITLLHGEPGSGKTNYIKYLMNQLPSVRKIYIPPFYIEAIGDPAFLGFIKNYSNSILLIEDAEKILVSREDQADNSAMSIILNLSDGIMGAVLNFKIIATFNTEESRIDAALKRRGRMFIKHHFGKLSKDKTKALYNKIYNEDPPESQMTLADIYNSESNGDIKPVTRTMGFVHA